VLVVAIAVVLGREVAPLAALRGNAFDAYQRLAPRPRLPAPVVIVAVDDASLAEYGQWPWPRTVLARLLDAIAEGRPAAIGVDILMPEADRLSPGRLAALVSGVDADLARRLAHLPGNDTVLGAIVARRRVVLGMAGVDDGERGVVPLSRRTAVRVVGGDPMRHVQVFPDALRAIDEIDAGAAGRGLVNTEPGDRVVRRLPVVAAVRDVLFASLGVEMLRVAAGERLFTVRAGRSGISAVEIGGLSVPTQPDGTVFIHYGRPDSSRYISAADVLSGRVDDVARFDRQLVLVGVTGTALGDIHATPVAARMPGVEIHAQWLESVFDGLPLLRPRWAPWAEAGVLALGGVLLIVALPALPAWSAALVVPLLVTFVAASGFIVYVRLGLLLDGAVPAFGLALVAAALMLTMLAEAQQQRRVLRQQVQAQREEAARVAGELEAARRIQMGILPVRLADEERVGLYAFLEPARVVGGDLYDFFRLDADHLFFVVADVSGNGVEASLFMAVSKALCKSTALRRRDDLATIIRDADDEISRDNPEALFVSAWAGLLDLRTGELQHCNAGHEPAWLVGRGDTRPRLLDESGGPPLCVLPSFPYVAASYRMEPGETICVVTDGVTEAENGAGHLYGRERLADVLGRLGPRADPNELGGAIRSDVARFKAGAPASDDLTILILRWHGGNATGTVSEP
jgi:serine phosphatase RsbU (regulator of sigma subunit)/CHASE2 domain-containing sensor protein